MMIPFDTFWSRLKSELRKGANPKPGVYIHRVAKWSQRSGDLRGEFTLVWQGGDTVMCTTATTDDWRNIAAAEFRKVYGAWRDYRSHVKGRSYIVHEIGVQNASWIIPILRKYEALMEMEVSTLE
jgi:hypothetical protein